MAVARATAHPQIVDIPNGQEVNYLIGSKGANINLLQSETGTHIAIQRAHECAPGAPTRQVAFHTVTDVVMVPVTVGRWPSTL